MAKTRTTVTLEEEVIRAVKIKAARDGRRESEVIEEALRRDLGLDVFERLWAESTVSSEEDADALALEAQRWARQQR